MTSRSAKLAKEPPTAQKRGSSDAGLLSPEQSKRRKPPSLTDTLTDSAVRPSDHASTGVSSVPFPTAPKLEFQTVSVAVDRNSEAATVPYPKHLLRTNHLRVCHLLVRIEELEQQLTVIKERESGEKVDRDLNSRYLDDSQEPPTKVPLPISVSSSVQPSRTSGGSTSPAHEMANSAGSSPIHGKSVMTTLQKDHSADSRKNSPELQPLSTGSTLVSKSLSWLMLRRTK